QAEDGIRDFHVTGVQTCALPICRGRFFCFRSRNAPPGSVILPHKGCLFGSREEKPMLRISHYLRALARPETGPVPGARGTPGTRSEERRVGKERRAEGPTET